MDLASPSPCPGAGVAGCGWLLPESCLLPSLADGLLPSSGRDKRGSSSSGKLVLGFSWPGGTAEGWSSCVSGGHLLGAASLFSAPACPAHARSSLAEC